MRFERPCGTVPTASCGIRQGETAIMINPRVAKFVRAFEEEMYSFYVDRVAAGSGDPVKDTQGRFGFDAEWCERQFCAEIQFGIWLAAGGSLSK